VFDVTDCKRREEGDEGQLRHGAQTESEPGAAIGVDRSEFRARGGGGRVSKIQTGGAGGRADAVLSFHRNKVDATTTTKRGKHQKHQTNAGRPGWPSDAKQVPTSPSPREAPALVAQGRALRSDRGP
jgi:hypothetical protein